MSELNSRARALLQTMQYSDEPSQADYDRVHAALEARIAVGVAVGVAVTLGATASAAAPAVAAPAATAAAGVATTAVAASVAPAAAVGAAVTVAGVGAGAAGAGASAAAAGTALLTKVAAWVVVAGVVAAGTATVARHATSSPTTSTVTPSTVAVEAPTKAAAPQNVARPVGPTFRPGIAAPGPAIEQPIAATATPSSPSAVKVPSKPASSPMPVTGVPAAASSPKGAGLVVGVASDPGPSSTLDAEIAALREARDALRSGSPDRALTVLDDSARRFPGGALAEDRAAERIVALCALGRVDEARSDAARFLGEHPRSSYAATVRASCGIGK